MNALVNLLYSFCETQGLKKKYWVAFSGGLDSSVLLACCHALAQRYPISFQVIHIDHQLHEQSKEWAQFAKAQAMQYRLPYVERTINKVKAQGESTEAFARQERYALFAEIVSQDEVIMTAHHQDDQAETVLLQLMRGAGVQGLAAMPSVKPLGKSILGRPFLHVARDTLQEVARVLQLKWLDDPSNHNQTFGRNYIRHEILPRLKYRWPAVNAMLARVAANCADAQHWLTDAINLTAMAGSREGTLSVRQLLQQTNQERTLALRQWIMQRGGKAPQQKKLRTIEETVLKSRWDKTPCVSLGNQSVRRHGDDLYLTEVTLDRSPILQVQGAWNLATVCVLPSVGRLQAVLSDKGHVPFSFSSLNVRFLSPSATIAVLGRGKKHSLKKLFQEWRVPPWQRLRTPLLFVNDELIGVPGYYWSHALCKSNTDQPKYKIIFHVSD